MTLAALLLTACSGSGDGTTPPVDVNNTSDAGSLDATNIDKDAAADAQVDDRDTDSSPDARTDAQSDAQVDMAQPEPCDYYSSPNGGGSDADGTEAHPWAGLESLAAAASLPTSGTLCLMDGFHGRPRIQGLAASSLIIRARNRRQAVVASLSLGAVSNLTLSGLVVDGSSVIDPQVDERNRFLVTGDVATTNVTLDDVLIQSADSIESWTRQDWVNLVSSGVDFRGTDITVRDSEIRNTYHALSLRGDRAWVEGTTIDNFGGDGIRGLGSGSTYVWNTVRDAYIDEYVVQHDDAFQAYKLEGDLRIADVTIAHNRFILFADPLTDFVVDNELVGTLMQGIIITDGYADGWVVEDNLIVNSQAHGISLFGARNCRVQNNTVVAHPSFVSTSGPWIRIADQTKTGQKNFDNIIRNNLAQMLTPWDYDVTSTVEANLEIGDLAQHFVNPAALDFHLKATSPAVNAGIGTDVTSVDLDGLPRVVGSAVDLGAFEQR